MISRILSHESGASRENMFTACHYATFHTKVTYEVNRVCQTTCCYWQKRATSRAVGFPPKAKHDRGKEQRAICVTFIREQPSSSPSKEADPRSPVRSLPMVWTLVSDLVHFKHQTSQWKNVYWEILQWQRKNCQGLSSTCVQVWLAQLFIISRTCS